jgi:hypothetical protein
MPHSTLITVCRCRVRVMWRLPSESYGKTSSFGRRPLRALAFSRDAGLNEDTTSSSCDCVITVAALCAETRPWIEISDGHMGVLFLT